MEHKRAPGRSVRVAVHGDSVRARQRRRVGEAVLDHAAAVPDRDCVAIVV